MYLCAVLRCSYLSYAPLLLLSQVFKTEKRNQLQHSLSKYRMDLRIIFDDFVGWLNSFLLAEFIGERW